MIGTPHWPISTSVFNSTQLFLKHIIELNPKYAEAYSNRGVAKIGKGDLDGALADYNRAIKVNPKFVESYINRGIVKDKVGNTNGSNVDFEKAIELNPRARKMIEALGYSVGGTSSK